METGYRLMIRDTITGKLVTVDIDADDYMRSSYLGSDESWLSFYKGEDEVFVTRVESILFVKKLGDSKCTAVENEE